LSKIKKNNLLKIKGAIIQLLVDSISTYNFDIYESSIGHQDQLLKMAFVDLLGRLQNAKDLNKMTELFKAIDPLYFLDPIAFQNLNTY
jgi:hypothetical protein